LIKYNRSSVEQVVVHEVKVRTLRGWRLPKQRALRGPPLLLRREKAPLLRQAVAAPLMTRLQSQLPRLWRRRSLHRVVRVPRVLRPQLLRLLRRRSLHWVVRVPRVLRPHHAARGRRRFWRLRCLRRGGPR